jgi:redox-sensitive bicupin YhaK (pirin superfamily)
LRRAAERGHVNHGWLDTWHTFSFASYHDPAHMGFRALRVINDDKIAAGKGFPMHPHKDMEIVTYVLAGSLAHKDSLGNGGVIVPGELQRMSAGTGIFHSEFNGSPKERLHLLQIWMLPNKMGIKPGYGQKAFPVAERQGKWKLVASPEGRDGSISIQSDTKLYATVLSEGEKAAHVNAAGRHVWLHVARGELTLNGTVLKAGDAAAVSDAGTLSLVAAKAGAEALLFDLA